eukprot:scaffold484179_cov30-Prasinocladus_malaysianus.AAC.1
MVMLPYLYSSLVMASRGDPESKLHRQWGLNSLRLGHYGLRPTKSGVRSAPLAGGAEETSIRSPSRQLPNVMSWRCSALELVASSRYGHCGKKKLPFPKPRS